MLFIETYPQSSKTTLELVSDEKRLYPVLSSSDTPRLVIARFLVAALPNYTEIIFRRLSKELLCGCHISLLSLSSFQLLLLLSLKFADVDE